MKTQKAVDASRETTRCPVMMMQKGVSADVPTDGPLSSSVFFARGYVHGSPLGGFKPAVAKPAIGWWHAAGSTSAELWSLADLRQ